MTPYGVIRPQWVNMPAHLHLISSVVSGLYDGYFPFSNDCFTWKCLFRIVLQRIMFLGAQMITLHMWRWMGTWKGNFLANIYLYRIPNSGHIFFTRIKKISPEEIWCHSNCYDTVYRYVTNAHDFVLHFMRDYILFLCIHAIYLSIIFRVFSLRHSYDYIPSVRDMWLMWNKGITPLIVPKVTFWCTNLSRSTAPLQYPIRRFMVRSRIVLKYHEVPIKLQSDRTHRYTNLAASRLMITKIPHIKT